MATLWHSGRWRTEIPLDWQECGGGGDFPFGRWDPSMHRHCTYVSRYWISFDENLNDKWRLTTRTMSSSIGICLTFPGTTTCMFPGSWVESGTGAGTEALLNLQDTQISIDWFDNNNNWINYPQWQCLGDYYRQHQKQEYLPSRNLCDLNRPCSKSFSGSRVL